ncbi:MAG: GGDEF domain-containing protein, partial [Burkholderiales bacterium]|nr:GGDEF domain-containing protein [Burkholderiales bacterium]
LYLDIDRFKNINDAFGHTAGDALLKGFAQRLSDCVRTTDTVARLAGDEFIVILEELHSREEGRAIAQKIVESMRPGFALESRTLNVTVSVGMAFFDSSENLNGDALITKADLALYQAKGGGRDNFREAE